MNTINKFETDSALISELSTRVTGEDVHRMNNYLAVYYGSVKLQDRALFDSSECKLRIMLQRLRQSQLMVIAVTMSDQWRMRA